MLYILFSVQCTVFEIFAILRFLDSDEIHIFGHNSKTQNRNYLENGAPYEEKYEQHFCAARREESNGLCFRSIRPILFLVMAENVNLTFDLWRAFRPEVEFQNEAYGKKALC